MDFLCEQEDVSLDWITGKQDLGVVGVTGSIVSLCLPVSLIYDQQRAPLNHRWFPLPPHFPQWNLLLDARRPLKRGLDFRPSPQPANSKQHELRSFVTTWMDQPHQHIHTFSLFVALFRTMGQLDMHIITPATPFYDPRPQISSVLLFMSSLLMKAFFLK